jgi:Fe-S-cluster containining protein
MVETENVHIHLTVDGTEIEAAVPLPKKPSPRRVLLPTLQKLTDTIVQIAETSAADAGERVSCKKGCDACCRQMVPISPTEAYGLAAVMDALPPARAAKTLARFDEAVETLDQKGLLERLLRRHDLSAGELRQLDRDYFAAQVACPFLENRACSIHADRPLACREFLVSSPAKFCRNPTGDRVRQIAMPAKVSVALAATDVQGWLPLTLARVFVAQHAEKVGKKGVAGQLREVLAAL